MADRTKMIRRNAEAMMTRDARRSVMAKWRHLRALCVEFRVGGTPPKHVIEQFLNSNDSAERRRIVETYARRFDSRGSLIRAITTESVNPTIEAYVQPGSLLRSMLYE